MANIALTRTRLKGGVTLRTQRGGTGLADIESPLALNDLIIVGAASQLVIHQDRETNNFRREFNPEYEGRPSETYPGLPIYKVTLHRVDLYDSNLLEAFGFTGVNIVTQYKPITIVADQPVPVDDAGNPLVAPGGVAFKTRSYIIPGCWINGLQIEYNIDDADQKQVVEIEMVVRDVISG